MRVLKKRKLKKIANDRTNPKSNYRDIKSLDYDDSYLILYANGNLDTILGFLN